MIVVLLAGICGLGITGWMMTSAAFWGVGWVEDVHELIANGMLLLVALHVGGVVLAGIRHGENLVAAMLTGRKRPT
jgi:cytochrome b